MKAVVLFSGGLDSTTVLCWALKKGYKCKALGVSYGQRHARELDSAARIARLVNVELIKVNVSFPWLKVSSLVDSSKKLPELPLSKIGKISIPDTYVPGRNTIFMALAVSLADSIGAGCIAVGANALDYSGYPDCRPAFYRHFQHVANAGTRAGTQGKGIRILAPLMRMSKSGIIRMALRLNVPLELTWSCYSGGRYPCGKCDSCKLRAKGFKEAGIPDPGSS